MNKESSVERHKILHRSLDELLACFLTQNPNSSVMNLRVVTLIAWSHRMTIDPTCAESDHQVRAVRTT